MSRATYESFWDNRAVSAIALYATPPPIPTPSSPRCGAVAEITPPPR